MRLALSTLLVFVLVVAVAVGYPPLEIDAKTQDTITLGGLKCGNKYRIKVSERNGGEWTDSRTKKRNTEPCPSPPPPTGGLPDASNTGVPPGTALAPSSGLLNVTTAGAVIDARDINGCVVVNAPNVTIKRSRIHGSCFFLVDNNSTGLVIEDSELDGGSSQCTAVASNNYTIRRSEFTGCENGLDIGTTGNVTFTDNYVHDLTVVGNDPHTDGIQIGQGAHDIVIRHNNISPQDTGNPASTSAIIMWTRDGVQNSRVWIENNRLDGSHAAYTLYAPRFPATEIYINNNRWLRAVFGYTDSVQVGRTVTQFNGNVDDLTGAPIPVGGSCGGC